ncbi:O-acyltransferase wsd1-like [Thalictrum thalictroides]|uniref:O-acyltransferase wsd1-like n=1 Tax=Thalictrum thalictroides TaxID=46969 RepID=A0A7J6XAZ3_THATH|nr:O-acyltransferase wsd1-like [Thalictrum thalictroides]
MAGPVEKASMAGRPLKSLYFTVPGVPQSLVFTIVTYMGNLRLVVNSERGYIDRDILTSCLKDAFTKIYAASVGEHPMKIE